MADLIERPCLLEVGNLDAGGWQVGRLGGVKN